MLLLARHLWWRGQAFENRLLELRGDRVSDIRALCHETPDAHAHIVCPPLTDLQVNGGGGTLINSDPTPDGLRAVAAAHHRLGTGTILPTVISDRFEVIEAAAQAALILCAAAGSQAPAGVVGLHIEGPHLAPERRGTHDAAFLRALDERTVRLVERLRKRSLPVMLTLAPERAPPALLHRLVACGAIVSGGHSAASAECTQAALDQGLACFTHLYNAMPPMTSRAPGILGAALESRVPAGIIVDGIHVCWTMLRIALRARPAPGLMFAVSDAMATVGGPDRFQLYGRTIRLQDGALVNAEGALAGAHIDLAHSLGNLIERVGLPFEQAMPMVCEVPRRLMKLPPANVDIGSDLSDLLVLDERFDPMVLG